MERLRRSGYEFFQSFPGAWRNIATRTHDRFYPRILMEPMLPKSNAGTSPGSLRSLSPFQRGVLSAFYNVNQLNNY